MLIRKYKTQDCQEIVDLFYKTIHAINARDCIRQLYYGKTSNQNDVTIDITSEIK